jgi:hypothetical protein
MTRKSLFSSIGLAAVIATVATVTLAAAAPAVAESGPAGKGLSAAPATRDASDFSARRREYRGGHRAAGAGLAVATPQYRRAYDSAYECSPVHCGPNYKREGAYSGYGAPIFTGW